MSNINQYYELGFVQSWLGHLHKTKSVLLNINTKVKEKKTLTKKLYLIIWH